MAMSGSTSYGAKLKQKQEELKHRQQQQQQHLPLSTLCRSAALKLRRAAMIAVPRGESDGDVELGEAATAAIESKVNHLQQFVDIVESSVMSHPQFKRYAVQHDSGCQRIEM